MSKKRYFEFDIMRTIAAYAVIFVHVSAIAFTLYAPGSPQVIITTAVNRLLKFTTPVFVYLGGLMVYLKYSKRPLPIKDFYKDRFVRILVPYMCFTLFYFAFSIFFHGLALSGWDLFKQLLTASAKYHLYFIAIITQLYLLSPLFHRWIRSKYRPYVLGAAFVITLISALYLSFPYSDRIFVKYLFPFLLGLLYGTEFMHLLENRFVRMAMPFVIAAAGLFYASTFYLSYFGYNVFSQQLLSFAWLLYTNLCIPALLIFSSFLSRYEKLTQSALSVTGFSYYIYLVHPAFIDIFERMWSYLGIYSTSIRFVLTLSLTLVTATLAARLIKGFNKKVTSIFH